MNDNYVNIFKKLEYPQVERIEKLLGDASSREYFRVFFKNRNPTVILMDFSKNEAAKSEEKSGNLLITEDPFINIATYLKKIDFSIPKIIYYDKKNKIIILEDLGDILLENITIEKQTYIGYYENAIENLVILHSKIPKNKEHFIPFNRKFNYDIFYWEFIHYLEYGLEKPGYKIKPKQREELLKIFQYLSTYFESLTYSVTHRDYHSRNIMIKDKKIYIIDFQDALMGPIHYDLASLLRDAYVKLNNNERESLIKLYLELFQKENNITIDYEKFSKDMDLMAFQRNLKAIGRFFYISLVKNKDHLLQYIPILYEYLDEYFKLYPEFKALEEILNDNKLLHKKLLMNPTDWRNNLG